MGPKGSIFQYSDHHYDAVTTPIQALVVSVLPTRLKMEKYIPTRDASRRLLTGSKPSALTD